MSIFLLFCILVVSFTTSEAIRCYDCEGSSKSGCNDPFNASVASITTGHNYCKKRGVVAVIRREGETLCTGTVWSAGSGTLCCTSDLCNHAHIFHGSLGIFFGAGFILLLVRMMAKWNP